jgi:hypothetical protein
LALDQLGRQLGSVAEWDRQRVEEALFGRLGHERR